MRAAACVLILAPALAVAQVRSFPYEAAIETDGVPIYSGPGGDFYETARLGRGSRVTVHRQDPGGWYMITPPAGEFSLIEASTARPAGPGIVEVAADSAQVRVGSKLAAKFDALQIEFARGTRATIATGVTPPAGWIAIRPPRGEYRWIPGKFVVPVPADVRSEHDADPFAVPSVAKRPESFDEPAAVPVAAQGPKLALGAPEPEPKPQADAAAVLRSLDRELEALTLAEPTDWPLDELAAGYRRLRESNPAAGRQIDVRLAQISRMRIVQEQYGDYVRLTSGTDLRDAELVAKAGAVEPQLAAAPGRGPTLAPPMKLAEESSPARPLLTDGETAAQPPAAAQPPVRIQGGPPYATAGVANAPRPRPRATAPAKPESAGPLLMAPGAALPAGAVAAAPTPAPGGAPAAPPSSGPRRFDAVGIVRKAVDPHPEAPQYVLVAPNGRILVYLREQPGIPLEKFVGRSMGVDGERHKHPEMTTPMIVVDRLTPVRF